MDAVVRRRANAAGWRKDRRSPPPGDTWGVMDANATARAEAAPTTEPVDLAALFDAHAPALLRLVERLTGPGGHVEDVVQDVFLVAHRREETLAAAESPRAWLYGIAVNLCRDHRRRGRRREGLWRLWGPR
ncbi:MAG: hypothetical protein EP329_04475, partial [Deltaproteobacteria bacterium]